LHENWSDPIIVCDYFAHTWLKDTCEEAQKTGRDARRHEVLFAVCFAESYLFEWVRDDVVSYNTSALNSYFIPGRSSDVRTKWKEVTKQLYDDGRIPQAPNWGSSHCWPLFNRHYRV
jgi:hypothetical protein